ncbi:MAG: HAD-IIB family hydrolase, partial [Caldilineaceae bacterium]|nr:HAD-IIB family hydrolase [Caldilineaceae bacterium]
MPNPSLPYDLVILDLDGTILDLYHANKIPESVRLAISAVQAAGIPVTIGTGRTLANMRGHIDGLGITHPAITTQGAVIGDPVTGEILAETTIPLALARRAADWVDGQAFIAAFYFNDAEGRTRVLQNRTGPRVDFYDHVFGSPRTIQPRFADALTVPDAHPPVKFLIVDDPDARVTPEADIVAELQSLFAPDLYVTRTHPQLVEGTAEGIDKGHGVRRLCQLFDIDPQRVLAIGDNDNDIPMLA